MKKLYSILALILVISMLAACGNDKDESEGTAPSGEGTVTEQTPSETDDSEDTGSADEDSNDTKTPSPSDEIQILKIGETALIQSTLGDFEVTPKEMNFSEEPVDGQPSAYGTYIEGVVEIKNVSDTPLNILEINDGRVVPQDNEIDADYFKLDAAEKGIEEIQPNETLKLNMVFDTHKEDTYHLVYGNVFVSNEVHWEFSGR